MRKVRQCPTKIQKMFEPSGLFEALQKEFCEEKEEEGKSCASQALIRLNNYISKKDTLVGRHNLSRMIAIRLSGAKEEEHAQYTSGAHLLQWISSPLLDGFSQGNEKETCPTSLLLGICNPTNICLQEGSHA